MSKPVQVLPEAAMARQELCEVEGDLSMPSAHPRGYGRDKPMRPSAFLRGVPLTLPPCQRFGSRSFPDTSRASPGVAHGVLLQCDADGDHSGYDANCFRRDGPVCACNSHGHQSLRSVEQRSISLRPQRRPPYRSAVPKYGRRDTCQEAAPTAPGSSVVRHHP